MKTKLNLCELLQVIIDARIDTMNKLNCTEIDFLMWYTKAIQDLQKILWIEWHFWM